MSLLDEIILVSLFGLATGSFGFALGIGAKNFTIPRLQAWIFSQMNAYVAGFLQNLHDNPETAEKMVQPFITAVLKQLQGDSPGGSPSARGKDFKIMGFKIPSELVQGLAERFLGNFLNEKTGRKALASAAGVVLPEA